MVSGYWFNQKISFPDEFWGEVITQEIVDEYGVFDTSIEFTRLEFMEREIDVEKLCYTIMNTDIGIDKLKEEIRSQYVRH